MAKGDADHAAADFSEAIIADPKSVDDYYNRAIAYGSQRNKIVFALLDFTQAIRLDPKNYLAFFNRGNTYG